MDFIDNVIDRSTGTIRGRAQFANAAGLFTPGYVRAHPRAGLRRPMRRLLVPDAAIGTEQARKFLLVVGPDNVVAQKYVTSARSPPTDCGRSRKAWGPTIAW